MIYDFSHWPQLPKVSCQCLTYGRPGLLLEAIESFLRQDYPGEKELIVLNDQPGVVLNFDHPEVKMINRPERVETIGGKRNKCARLSVGQILIPWDDDDIHLPWRISVIVSEMKNYHFFKPKRFWVSTQNRFQIEQPSGGAPSMAGFSKELWAKVGRYPEMQSGQDTEFQKRIKEQFPKLLDIHYTDDEKVSYIYRWGTGYYHLSGYGRGQRGFDIIRQRSGETISPGEYDLQPGWREDYVEKVRTALNKKAAEAA